MEKLDQDILEATKNIPTELGKDSAEMESHEKLANLLITRRVLPFIPDDVEDRANHLDEFARTLFKKYQVQEDTDILPVGIQLSRDAVSWTLDGHTEKPARVANLGAWLLRRYEKNRDKNDLLEAIEKTELAVSLLEKDNFNQLRFLTNLAIMLFRQLELTWDENDPDQLEIMTSRADIGRGLQVNSIAHPLLGIEAARDAIRIFKFHGKLKEANFLAQKALQLLPMACHPSITRQDQQHAIQQMSRFAAEACSLSLLVGKTEEALLSIEFSYEIILCHLIKYSNKLSLLEQQSKRSAERFDQFRSTAAQPVDTMDQITIQDRVVPEIQDFAHDHAFELALIRNLPNFGEFLTLPNLDDLVEGATNGSIVIVNITPLSSDAFIIQKSGQRIRSLNLPNATSVGNSFLDEDSKAFSRKVPGHRSTRCRVRQGSVRRTLSKLAMESLCRSDSQGDRRVAAIIADPSSLVDRDGYRQRISVSRNRKLGG
ncbi:TPR domain-containing protein [Fusarium pseudocircinatum]|uniref:TPR domain-containing protein n=1 Tax=Fusarium pseudocircinatum TaxID=56676 RepID=A0A8H5LC11_9HYPO|nr:TPR domain-containing protein [Fusarium pseudocircinatum]